MEIVIGGIRKIVILVLLMELVIQMQSGKQYEPYLKILVGIMVAYSIVQGIFGAFGDFTDRIISPMEEFKWSGEWNAEWEEQISEQDTQADIKVGEIRIDEISIDIFENER